MPLNISYLDSSKAISSSQLSNSRQSTDVTHYKVHRSHLVSSIHACKTKKKCLVSVSLTCLELKLQRPKTNNHINGNLRNVIYLCHGPEEINSQSAAIYPGTAAHLTVDY